jgi:hypothetical protein
MQGVERRSLFTYLGVHYAGGSDVIGSVLMDTLRFKALRQAPDESADLLPPDNSPPPLITISEWNSPQAQDLLQRLPQRRLARVLCIHLDNCSGQ